MTLLLCLLQTAAGQAQPAVPDPDAAFLPAWNQLPDRAGWQMLVSPAFPGTWPQPSGRGTLVRYSFAMRLDPAVADAVEMAAPWARSTQSAAGDVVVQRLASRLQPLGLQGVRPLDGSEIALLDHEQEVAQRLRAGGEQATDDVVRAFTCNWIARQGAVAAAIMPSHPDFNRWLACP